MYSNIISETILLSLLYPSYKSTNSSRFEKLFKQLSKIDDENDNIQLEIYPSKVLEGKDKRTSIIIKNIPRKIKKKRIRKIIESIGNINFFYHFIENNGNNVNTSGVYINLVNYRTTAPLYMAIHKMIFHINDIIIKPQILYSPFQGRNELFRYLNISKLENDL